jgi:prepilin-type N-terminal cleavage/methylation domain-containing protein
VKNNKKGFTIIEVMAVLVISFVLLSLGIPKVGDYVVGQRVQSDAASFANAFTIAKNKAVLNRKEAYLISPNSNDDWSVGWRVSVGNDELFTKDKNMHTVIESNIMNFKISPRGVVYKDHDLPMTTQTIKFCAEDPNIPGVNIGISGLGKVSREVANCN